MNRFASNRPPQGKSDPTSPISPDGSVPPDPTAPFVSLTIPAVDGASEPERSGNVEPSLTPPARPQPIEQDLSCSRSPSVSHTRQTALTSSVLTSQRSTLSNVTASLTAPATLTGIGNSILLSNEGVVASAVMGALTVLSFLNEWRLLLRKNSDASRIGIDPDQKPLKGFTGYMRERLSTPGICVEAQAWTYLAATFVALTSGDYANAFSYAAFSAGEGAAAAISNQGALYRDRVKMLVESAFNAGWNLLPERLKLVLSNPAAVFSIGNIPLYGLSLYKGLVAGTVLTGSNSVVLGTIAAGSMCTCAAAIYGLKPLLDGQHAKQSTIPFHLNSAGNFLLGSCMIFIGTQAAVLSTVITGAAVVIWGFSNTALAVRVARQIEQGKD